MRIDAAAVRKALGLAYKGSGGGGRYRAVRHPRMVLKYGMHQNNFLTQNWSYIRLHLHGVCRVDRQPRVPGAVAMMRIIANLLTRFKSSRRSSPRRRVSADVEPESSPASNPQRRGRLPALGAVVAIVIGVAVALSNRSSGAGQSLETPDRSFAVTVPTSYACGPRRPRTISPARRTRPRRSRWWRALRHPRGARDGCTVLTATDGRAAITLHPSGRRLPRCGVIFQCPVKDPTGTAP